MPTKDGVILLDKPAGMTSHDVVNYLRSKLDTRRIGHTGILDPNATGLLVMLVGLAVLLASPAALLVSVVFVLYLDRFQITPEERALEEAFGSEYVGYRARVRRWL